MRVLVTGASGFLGYHLTRMLEQQHETMAAYCTRPVVFDHAATTQLDVRVANQCACLVAGFAPTHVVHAAAMTLTGECERQPEQARMVNVQGTQNLLDAAQALEPRPHFVFVSTDLVFNGQRGTYREIDPTDPLQVYGRTKEEAELLVGRYTGPWTIIRSALIFGPPDEARPTFLNWMLDGIRTGTGALFEDEYRSPVYVHDLAAAVVSACTLRAQGIYHCAGPDRLSRYQFGLMVAKAFGLPASNVQRAQSSSVTAGAPRPRDVSMDISKARHDLNYSPTPAVDALRRVAAAQGM